MKNLLLWWSVSIAEYAFPVWVKSALAKNLDAALNLILHEMFYPHSLQVGGGHVNPFNLTSKLELQRPPTWLAGLVFNKFFNKIDIELI